MLEGSVQSVGGRIRVNAQLIDADTGAHLWAERFDKPRADLFDMQDEITTRLARTVGISWSRQRADARSANGPDNMDSVDLAMRGRAVMNRPPALDNAQAARALFEAALRLDSCNVDALVGFAETHVYRGSHVCATAGPGKLALPSRQSTKRWRSLPITPTPTMSAPLCLFLTREPQRGR